MAIDRDQMITDLRAIINTRPITATINSHNYTGLLARSDTDKDYLPEGSKERYKGTLSVVYDDIEDAGIDPRDVVTISGTEYRIEQISTDSYQIRTKYILL